MAQSWRLKTVEQDNTQKTATSTPIIGSTAIISPKGPKTFVRFDKGDTQGILNTFGYPSKDYPSIQDALDAVTRCSMYVASPYKGGTYGGVFITKSGTIPFNTGVSTKTITDYGSVNFTNQIAISDGSTITYDYTIEHINKYNKESFKLFIGGEEVTTLSIIAEGDIETITDTSETPILNNEACSLNTTTGELSLTFTTSFTVGTIISIGYTVDLSDTYFVLFDKNMQEDDLQIMVSKSTDVDDGFEIVVARYDPINLEYVEVNNSPFLVGLSETSKDTYGDNIYIEKIFGDNQQLFDAHVVTSIIDDFTDDDAMVNLSGGSRGEEVDGDDVANIYDQLIDTSRYQIKFCFDGTGFSEVVTKFETLRTSYQKRCRFFYPTQNVDGATIVANPNDYNYGITANRGLYQYCLTWGIHKDVYQGNDFLCSNMGLVAQHIYDSIYTGMGTPAWIDENGCGGIIGSAITKLSQEGTSEDILEQLDNLNFNPVVNDYTYGPMIVSWRTRQVKKTIFSNIPQSSLADTIIELIEKEVMPYRIGKIIDEGSYAIVRSGVGNIMSAYSQFFEDYYVWCDGENNTPEMREREQLVITVGVVFKNIARTVLLQFKVYPSGTDVEVKLKQ